VKNCQSVTIIPQKIRFFAGGIEFDGAQSIIKKQIMDDNNLNNGLDDLLNMFKKMMENQDLDAIPGINEEQKEQLKMFLEDFDELKDDMKVEIYKLDPFTKQMVGMVMGQLKNFTGGQATANPTVVPQEPPVNKEKQLTDIPGTTENLEAHLAAIDEKLRNPELSDDDINRLLDERTSIMKELEI
jgi:hypothetical protein